MRRCAAPICGVALWACLAGPAAAQDGAGLYEPFPEPAAPEVSRDFIADLPAPGPRLGTSLTGEQLERGVRLRALPAAAAAGPAARAEPDGTLGTPAGWLGAAALAALAAFAALRVARR